MQGPVSGEKRYAPTSRVKVSFRGLNLGGLDLAGVLKGAGGNKCRHHPRSTHGADIRMVLGIRFHTNFSRFAAESGFGFHHEP